MIKEEQYISSAQAIGCEVEVLKAVVQVESQGSGFLPSNECKILFEPHIFWNLLEKYGRKPIAVLNGNPSLSTVLYEKWKTLPYGKMSEQWDKLRLAAQVDWKIAYQAASYGTFQILGSNFRACCFSSIDDFVKAMTKIDPSKEYTDQDESEHLIAFVNFLHTENLHLYLRDKNWEKFASGYNGRGYKQGTVDVRDDYSYKLKQAYDKIRQKLDK